MDADGRLDIPRSLRRGRRRKDGEWLPVALGLLDLVANTLGRADLGSTSVLDVGCGTKFTTAFVNHGVPIKRYVGVDTDGDVIAYLAGHVNDPRLSFHHLNAHNDLYNAGGQPLASFERLPVGEEQFDVISLFSVFTHLAPHDYTAMLELLRPHVAPGGKLIFSLFVDEDIDPAQRDAFNRELRRRREAGDPEVIAAIEARQAAPREIPDFLDRVPERPLLEAVYSEPYARRLLEGTGWDVMELRQPIRPIIQHHFICKPAYSLPR